MLFAFSLPNFRIAISRGALCHVLKVYFCFRFLRLNRIAPREGLDKIFHRKNPKTHEKAFSPSIQRRNPE
jgi:hypothetical protein